ncbi:hypothetical protein [Vacuolonema iberomarrocanum]|uniref:hypothetical protein n=1 Tax=Vacuolonema iberomarrocanum TaxID=3454632 RepID=UPI001A1032E6|nr:TerB family tellurite resistance protein [filamentous cyanobacterium LEGE 07170]
MNFSSSVLESFSADLYLSTLAQVAHSDGLHPDEEAILREQAANFGLDILSLPDVPHNLAELPWTTRVLVYRDAFMLAHTDEKLSDEENSYLMELARRLDLPVMTVNEIKSWVSDYDALLSRLNQILSSNHANLSEGTGYKENLSSSNISHERDIGI